MRYPARGPNLLGIDGKSNAAGRRIDSASETSARNEAARMRYQARGPNLLGIDGKSNAARRRTSVVAVRTSGIEAPRVSPAAAAGLREIPRKYGISSPFPHASQGFCR